MLALALCLFFLPRDAYPPHMHSAVYAMAGVRLSVTRRRFIESSELIELVLGTEARLDLF